MSTLDNLRKDAKRWLKALRENDPQATARLAVAYPKAPKQPALRDVQHALALENGSPSWAALVRKIDSAPPAGPDPALDPSAQDSRVAAFLEFACWDHHVHGRGDYAHREESAMRLLRRYPEIARSNLYTAVVCGELTEVARLIAANPESARTSGGPRGWTPLLYLTYARLPWQPSIDNSLSIARLLLEHGADSNTYYMAGDSPYTALVGVAGEGEQDAHPHPVAEEFYRLLLEAGAGPYDQQVLYNTHFRAAMLWWLDLTYAHCQKTGRTADWHDQPEWPMFDMGNYGTGARFILGIAVKRNDLQLAEWALARGANPNAVPARDPRHSKRSLYQDAVVSGNREMADLLVRHGAVPVEPVLDDQEAYVAACLRLDRVAVQAFLENRPEYLHSAAAIHEAARRDRPDVIALLLDLGTPIEAEDKQRQRPLHAAAGANALRAAAFLLERGAEPDPREANWNATPIGFANHDRKLEMINLLAPHSRDIWSLTRNGKLDRLRALFAEQPALARTASSNGFTPLWWLPADDTLALEIANLFLEHGADAGVYVKDGSTAADYAHKQGRDELARLLRDAAASSGHSQAAPPSAPPPPDLERLAKAARDLLTAHETGDAAAMAAVRSHFRIGITDWQQLRARVREHLAELRAEDRGTSFINLDDAQFLVARSAGFKTWDELATELSNGESKSAQPPYAVDKRANRVRPRRLLFDRDWETVLRVIGETGISGLDAEGQMTDEILDRVANLPGVTHLNLEGSRQLTGAGIRHLARMKQLRFLKLTGCPIADDDLKVLRELPELRRLEIQHHRGITDAGASHIADCRHLEAIDLMNTRTGDGTLKALAGKPKLHYVKAGNNVTAKGAAYLHDFPVFKAWQGGEPSMSLMSPDAGPNFLWLYLKGAEINAALAQLAGLNGLFGLSIHGGSDQEPFDGNDHLPVTAADLKPVASLPNLGWLGLDGHLCDSAALGQVGAIPNLKMLMAQSAVAADDGFDALAKSRTLEYLWGRYCPNFSGAGFRALSRIPTLRGMAISCRHVDDAALATLPDFPSLHQLMPMDFSDDGFRYIGQCARLEQLWCMYCRETSDAATEHLARLTQLRTYYAGKTRITNRSLEVLGGIDSLEELTFWQCGGITDAGLVHLSRLPNLREIHFEGGMPNVTLEGTAVFPPGVHVDHRT